MTKKPNPFTALSDQMCLEEKLRERLPNEFFQATWFTAKYEITGSKSDYGTAWRAVKFLNDNRDFIARDLSYTEDWLAVIDKINALLSSAIYEDMDCQQCGKEYDETFKDDEAVCGDTCGAQLYK